MKTKFLLLLIVIASIAKQSFGQNAEDYINRGRKKLTLKDYKGSIEDNTKAIELNPKNDTAYNIRGHYRDDSSSIKDFNKAIDLNPSYAEAYYNRGMYYYHFNKYKEAIENYNKVIELNPKNEYAYLFRGYAKMFFIGGYLGKPGGACSDWQKAVELGDIAAKDLIDKYCK